VLKFDHPVLGVPIIFPCLAGEFVPLGGHIAVGIIGILVSGGFGQLVQIIIDKSVAQRTKAIAILVVGVALIKGLGQRVGNGADLQVGVVVDGHLLIRQVKTIICFFPNLIGKF
jgi:hypothetical protein